MNSDQAKAVAGTMIALWQSELPATVRVLAAVRDDQRDYRPHERSRSAWELVTHIPTADVWFLDCILNGAFVFDPDAAKQAEAQFGNVADAVAFHEREVPARLARLAEMPGDTLAESLSFFDMMRMPRAQWIGFANNHCIHHRGQLSAYLRAMGCVVPDIYGPSADSALAAS